MDRHTIAGCGGGWLYASFAPSRAGYSRSRRGEHGSHGESQYVFGGQYGLPYPERVVSADVVVHCEQLSLDPPAWLRNAKFGMWVHYGPQASLASGDWSAQHMYQPGSTAYNNHLAHFGHPSVNGYKDVVNAWNPVDYSPPTSRIFTTTRAPVLFSCRVFTTTSLTTGTQPTIRERNKLRAQTGHNGRMGFGYEIPRDAVWRGIPHEYGWWFYQPAYLADTSGTYAGVPYDAKALIGSNGAGTWWQNYDLSRSTSRIFRNTKAYRIRHGLF